MIRSIFVASILVVPALGLCATGVPVARAQDAAIPAAPITTVPGSAATEEPESEDLMAALHGGPGGLTATMVARSAVRTSPSVEQARAAASAAQAGAVRAIGAFFPRVDTYARYMRLSPVEPIHFFPQIADDQAAILRGTAAMVTDPNARALLQTDVEAQIAEGATTLPVLLNQTTLHAGVQWSVLDIFLTVLPTYNANDQLASSSRYQLDAQRQTVAEQAREAFYNYARARAALIVAQLSLAQSQAHEGDVRAQVEAGVAAPVEGMRIDAQLANAQVQVARARGGVAGAEVALRTLLHVDSHTALSIGEDLTQEPAPLRGDADTLLSAALDRRPEIVAIRHIVQARDAFVGVRTGQLAPHVILLADADYANPNQRIFPQQDRFVGTWDVGATVTWSPNDLFNATQDLDAAHADAANARAQLAQLEDGVRVEVTQAYENESAAREALSAANVGETAAEEAYRVRRERYRAGAATTTELIDAASDLSNARLNLVNAAIDLHIADARMRHAVGEDVTGATATRAPTTSAAP